MTVTPKGDAFTYAGAGGDGDTERMGSLVGIVGSDGKAIDKLLASKGDADSQNELLMSINDRLGAVVILLSELIGDKPETFIESASSSLKTGS